MHRERSWSRYVRTTLEDEQDSETAKDVKLLNIVCGSPGFGLIQKFTYLKLNILIKCTSMRNLISPSPILLPLYHSLSLITVQWTRMERATFMSRQLISPAYWKFVPTLSQTIWSQIFSKKFCSGEMNFLETNCALPKKWMMIHHRSVRICLNAHSTFQFHSSFAIIP